MSEYASAGERPAVQAERPPPAAEARPSLRARLRQDRWFFFVAAGVLALDQVTKAVVRATVEPGIQNAWPDRDWALSIVNVTNSGAAFGILQGQTTFLIVTSAIGLAAIVLYYLFPPLEHGLLRAALALQLGGAAGNLADRARAGEVTDFMKFEWWIVDWPAFNVADTCISIGVVTILWFFLVVEAARFTTPRSGG